MVQPSVALVYDRVNTPFGGAEHVISAIHQAFPTAPLFTSVYDPARATWAADIEVCPSFINQLPGAKRGHRWYAPLMPLAFESFDLSAFDIVISITSAEAKGVITTPEQLHLCYLLTPTRYLWSHRDEYEATHWPFQIPGISWFSRKCFDYLRWWDTTAATRPDVIIPISRLVKQRTQQYYQRNTIEPIYPPIPIGTAIQNTHHQSSYLLVISRLVPYKRIDLVIAAAQQLNQPLVIIGEGPAEHQLRKMSNQNVTFMRQVSESDKFSILAQAKALVMPGIEDFGITALEAVQAGVPVILHRASGAAELLEENATALYLEKATLAAVIDALKKLDNTRFEFTRTRKKLEKYAITNFSKRFKQTVLKFWKEHHRKVA